MPGKNFAYGVLAVLLLPLVAWGDNNSGNPAILNAVNNVQSSINALQSTVDNIQTSTAGPTGVCKQTISAD